MQPTHDTYRLGPSMPPTCRRPAFQENVLVIDDESQIGRMIADLLVIEKYNPIICGHPREALEHFENDLFPLAFIDINLPDMSGIELATRLKEREPACEIVLMTGYGTFDNAVQAIKIGAYDYLRKPFGINELKLCLKRYQERQTLKQKKRIAEQRYSDLVQNIPLIIFVIREDFRLEFINRACSAMLGYRPEEALDDPCWFLERFHPQDRERVVRQVRSIFASKGSSLSMECRMTHKSERIIHTIIKSNALPLEGDKDDALEYLEGTIVDISDRVLLEKRVVQKEKLKTLDAVSAEFAHEIRNPLVSIGGFARRLRQKFPKLPEGAIILHESERLEKMLKKITEYLKPVEICFQTYSVNKVVTDCVELLTPDLAQQRIVFQTNLDASLSDAPMDREILAQLFTSLIQNAAQEMGGGGTLHVRTYDSDQNFHVEFRNQHQKTKTGNLEHLIMPFDQGDQKMGLPLSVRALKSMGGLLSVTQEQNNLVFMVSHPKHVQNNPETDNLLTI